MFEKAAGRRASPPTRSTPNSRRRPDRRRSGISTSTSSTAAADASRASRARSSPASGTSCDAGEYAREKPATRFCGSLPPPRATAGEGPPLFRGNPAAAMPRPATHSVCTKPRYPAAARPTPDRSISRELNVRIAIVGAGIAGLGSAWLLQRQGHAVTLFEADARLGGHTHTVDVTLDGVTASGRHRIPRIQRAHVPAADRALRRARRGERRRARCRSRCASTRRRLEWAGTNLAALFAQPGNALRPAFWRMLADIARFNRDTTAMIDARRACGRSRSASSSTTAATRRPFATGTCCRWRPRSGRRRESDMLDFPLPTFVRFCHNHGLLQIADRPQWRTVRGGARVYVAKDRSATRATCALAHAGAAHPAHAPRRRDRLAAGRTRRFDAGRARLPQRPGARASRRPVVARSAPARRRSATSRTASCCTPTCACCRAHGAPGRRGITSPPTTPAASSRSRSAT